MVILANVESAPPQAVTHLESFVDGGGGLLIFLGDKTNAAFLNQSFSGSNRLHGGLLPGPVIGMSGDPDSESQLTQIGQIDGNHVVLSSFDDGRTGSFSSVNLKAFWDLDPGEASVLMRTDTGAPLLCEHAFGEGTVMVFASSCDRDWTNFPVRPAFLPWIYRLVGYLSSKPATTCRFRCRPQAGCGNCWFASRTALSARLGRPAIHPRRWLSPGLTRPVSTPCIRRDAPS